MDGKPFDYRVAMKGGEAIGFVAVGSAAGYSSVLRVMVGVDRARQSAERDGRPCALSLTAEGWRAPAGSVLPPCRAAGLALAEPLSRTEIQLSTNLPESLRFSLNGLVLDGGLVVLSSPGSSHRRCVVISLPLGVTREGLYGQDPITRLSSGLCRPLPGAPA